MLQSLLGLSQLADPDPWLPPMPPIPPLSDTQHAPLEQSSAPSQLSESWFGSHVAMQAYCGMPWCGETQQVSPGPQLISPHATLAMDARSAGIARSTGVFVGGARSYVVGTLDVPSSIGRPVALQAAKANVSAMASEGRIATSCR